MVSQRRHAARIWCRAIELAAVIVNYRSADDTSACVASLGDIGQVVIVDNDSGDGSVEHLRERHPQATLIARDSNDGFAAGVNAGVAATRAPYVLLMNPDATLRPGALAAMVGHLETHAACAVAVPRMWLPDGSRQASVYRRFFGTAGVLCQMFLPAVALLQAAPALDRWVVRDFHPGEHVAWGCGAALLVRRAAFEPLDERFFLYFEETEWQARLIEHGWTVDLVDADVDHQLDHAREALAPPAAYVRSAMLYLQLRGRSRATARRLVRAALRGTQLTMRARGRRDVAAAYGRLLRETA